MKQYLIKWVEQYLFFPTPFQQLISIALLPLTVIYCVIAAYKRISQKPFDFGIPVISIGNLVVGGSGKTPVTIELTKDLKDIAVVLRGYGRESKGLYVVSDKGKILEDVKTSGDEAMLYAKSLPDATVIVAEVREEAILKAKELGLKAVYLDDGYSKHGIKKFDILIRPQKEPTNIFCLPSGGYRDTKMLYSFADAVLRDGVDFKRTVTFSQNGKNVGILPEKLVLVTAISKADRLLEYLPKDIKTKIFPDHYSFTKDDIQKIQSDYEGFDIVTTQKDLVKLEQFHISPFVMDLNIEIVNKEVLERIEKYKDNYNV